MSNTSALELAQGFHARKYATFTEAMRLEDPRWILGIEIEQPADKMAWKNREHRVWFCLLIHGAEVVGIPTP